MQKLVKLHESIECLSAEIVSRKFIWESIINHPDAGRCVKYKTDRNSWARNIRELDPKCAVISKESKLDLGDCLESDSLLILNGTLKKFNLQLVNQTSTHKAQSITTNHYTYVQIIKPFSWVESQLSKSVKIT